MNFGDDRIPENWDNEKALSETDKETLIESVNQITDLVDQSYNSYISIKNANILINDCKTHLDKIKINQLLPYEEYLTLSSKVVERGVYMVIASINEDTNNGSSLISRHNIKDSRIFFKKALDFDLNSEIWKLVSSNQFKIVGMDPSFGDDSLSGKISDFTTRYKTLYYILSLLAIYLLPLWLIAHLISFAIKIIASEDKSSSFLLAFSNVYFFLTIIGSIGTIIYLAINS